MAIDVIALVEAERDDWQRCATCRWISSRPKAEAETWHKAIDNRGYHASQIARAMARVADSAVAAPSAGSVVNHRGGHTRSR